MNRRDFITRSITVATVVAIAPTVLIADDRQDTTDSDEAWWMYQLTMDVALFSGGIT